MRKKLEGRITIRMSKALISDLRARAKENDEDVVGWARRLLTWGLYSNDAKVALEQVKGRLSDLEGKQEISETAITNSLAGVEGVLTGLTDRQEKLVEVVKRLADNLEVLVNPKRERAI